MKKRFLALFMGLVMLVPSFTVCADEADEVIAADNRDSFIEINEDAEDMLYDSEESEDAVEVKDVDIDAYYASPNSFTDVNEKDNFYEAVMWAVSSNPKIVEGVTATKFKPSNICNRAQTVTFLWRVSGSPEPKTGSNPFVDVKTSDFFYKPVLWAYENQITLGINKNEFGPYTSCTRAQFVTFLWRAAGQPDPVNKTCPFKDVESGKFYTDPILWANEKGITGGKTADRFGVNDIVTRAQVVMFLYRAYHVTGENADNYSYEIIPILPPFNEYFYIKTENPDPDSFCFIDKVTRYSEGEGSISPSDTNYSDVVYQNGLTRRVSGGYIARGSYTDGGTLYLQIRTVTGETPVYNLSTGEVTYMKDYKTEDTDVAVNVKPLVDEVDYLIQNYGDTSKGYFDNMSSIQSGFSKICLYSGASIRGELVKSTASPYYGLSNSPHVDQNFYIQDPYSRKSGRKLFVSDLYPYRYDSIGFPSMMISISKRIQPDATYVWNSGAHYLVDFTYNGETKSYGGQGYGGGQQITGELINSRYSFNCSKSDAYMSASLEAISSQLKYYGSLTVPDDIPEEGRLTWAMVKKAVTERGAYVKLYSFQSSDRVGYSYLYHNGNSSEGSAGFASIGYISNAWFDGRFFNRNEVFEKGLSFGDTSYNGVDTSKASIVFLDRKIKLPDDGKTYLFNGGDLPENYNPETGVWGGFTTYTYDSQSGNWVARHLRSIWYRDGYETHFCDDPDFIDACTLTPDEVAAMGIDRNKDKNPSAYYVYDMVTEPGTYVSGE
ncbi:MAG: S-layer homology domain-containing protein [Eubacterium sp.]|nr:S-layer homology domain-containing protein [Eubacterium sp.]